MSFQAIMGGQDPRKTSFNEQKKQWIAHIIMTRAFFCFENYSPIKARNITHKITPALLTNI